MNECPKIIQHYLAIHVFLGLGLFGEFEIRELKIHDFPPNSLWNDQIFRN